MHLCELMGAHHTDCIIWQVTEPSVTLHIIIRWFLIKIA